MLNFLRPLIFISTSYKFNMTQSNIEPPKLLDLVRGKIRLKHYSIRTEQAYVDWIKRYIWHQGKHHPKNLNMAQFVLL